MKTYKLEVVELVLKEKDTTATGVVKVNGKNRAVTVKNEYIGGGAGYQAKVTVDGFDDKTIADLDIALDYSAVVERYKALLKEKETQEEKARKKSAEILYASCPLHQLIKALPVGTKFSQTKEEFVKESNRDLMVEYVTKYKGEDVKVYIRYERYYSRDSWRPEYKGYRFETSVGSHYGREWTKRTAKSDKVVKQFTELLDMLKASIDRNQARESEADKKKKIVASDISSNVTSERYSYGGYSSRDCFQMGDKKDYKSRVIKFTAEFSSEDKPEARLYKIREIDGYFTAEQLKQIIVLVHKAKME